MGSLTPPDHTPFGPTMDKPNSFEKLIEPNSGKMSSTKEGPIKIPINFLEPFTENIGLPEENSVSSNYVFFDEEKELPSSSKETVKEMGEGGDLAVCDNTSNYTQEE